MCKTDTDCVESCLNGHPEAFRHLLRRYQSAVLTHLTGRLGSADQAEEAAQESFVRAYFALGKLRKRGSFLPWVIGIADRVAKEHWRQQRRQRQAVRQIAPASSEPRRSADVPLAQAVAQLPDAYRQVVLLRYYCGLSCSQIGEQLGVPVGTVTKQLSRAYAMLREALSEQEVRA